MTEWTSSNSLVDLAERVKIAHEAALTAAQTAIDRAREAGRLLAEAKLQLRHGEWLPWLRTTELSARTAQGYMQLARLSDAEYATRRAFGIRGALATLAKPPSAIEQVGQLIDEIEDLVEEYIAASGDRLSVLVQIIDAATRHSRSALSVRPAPRPGSRFQTARLPDEPARFPSGRQQTPLF